MARGNSTEDLSTLQMALVGYQIEKQRIDAKIQEIQARLKGKAVASPTAANKPEESETGTEPRGTEAHRGRAEEALGRTPQKGIAGESGISDWWDEPPPVRPRWRRAP